MRIAVLWKFWNDYLEASLEQLASVPGVEVLLCDIPAPPSTTPNGERRAGIGRCSLAEGDAAIQARLESFRPDLILICSWNVPAYRRLAREWRGRAIRILYMDNQWLGTLRQRMSVLASPAFLWPAFDAAFVTGQRQARFARRLGFTSNRTATGGIVADTRTFQGEPGPSGFLFVGRLVPEKGIDVLVEAYGRYRQGRTDAWPLVVCGDGPERFRLAGIEGITERGFVSPLLLPAVMSDSACLVLPSRFEPFGVVVHEATSAGLYVIATDAVGATDLFVDDGVNGRVVASPNPDLVASAMNWMHDQPAVARRVGVQRSHDLSSRQSPESWASALIALYGRFDLSRRVALRARTRQVE